MQSRKLHFTKISIMATQKVFLKHLKSVAKLFIVEVSSVEIYKEYLCAAGNHM